MAGKKKKTVKQKVKKKKWITIFAPKSFNNIKLGETNVVDTEQAVGKTIKANLMNLTGSMKKQNVVIRFDVDRVSEGNAHTYVSGFENTPSLMKRIVRKGRTKVEDSFIAKTKEDYRIRVKPVVITLNRASKGAQSAVRALIKEKLTALVAGLTFEKFVQELVNYSIQKALKEEGMKAHPIKGVEVRAAYILSASKKNIVSQAEESEEAKEVTEETAETEKVTKDAVKEVTEEAKE